MDMQTERIADLLARAALPLLRRRHHDQPGVDRVPRQEVRRGAAAGRDRHAGDLRARAAARVRARLRGQPADRARRACSTRSASSSRRPPRSTACARDAEFDPETSELVLGPINKPRWIYSCAKQLMDRVIHAYGMQEGLDYTLFRPFNWIGAGLDSINTREGRQLARHHAVPRPHRARRADQAGRRRHAEARVHLHRRRHRGADEDHRRTRTASPAARSTTSATRPTTARCASSREMMLDAGARLPGIRATTPRKVDDRRDDGGRVLRQGLPGRAEPRAEDRQHLRRSRLEAAWSAWRTRCSASSTRIAGRSPRRARLVD